MTRLIAIAFSIVILSSGCVTWKRIYVAAYRAIDDQPPAAEQTEPQPPPPPTLPAP